VLLGSKDGQSNLGRGEWLVNGVYQVAFTPARQYTVTFATGSAQNVCDEIG
jgi:hypothetical protein